MTVLTNGMFSTIVDMSEMFSNTTDFNQLLPSWNTEQVTNMFRLFFESGFENSLGSWNVSNVTEMTEMFAGAKMTLENYDNTLVAWSRLPLQTTITFDAGESQYCLAEDARAKLIDDFGWGISDAGFNCPEQNAFVTTWKTNNLGKSNDNQLILPSRGGPFTIDWGDGSVDSEEYGEVRHTYAEAGVYTVKISGDFFRIRISKFLGK